MLVYTYFTLLYSGHYLKLYLNAFECVAQINKMAHGFNTWAFCQRLLCSLGIIFVNIALGLLELMNVISACLCVKSNINQARPLPLLLIYLICKLVFSSDFQCDG